MCVLRSRDSSHCSDEGAVCWVWKALVGKEENSKNITHAMQVCLLFDANVTL